MNTINNNPFVLTAVSSNVHDLSNSLLLESESEEELLYGTILSSCKLSSCSQQEKRFTNCDLMCVCGDLGDDPIHCIPPLSAHGNNPMVAEKCKCRVQWGGVGSKIFRSHTTLTEFAKT